VERARIDGIELEIEVRGAGEPVLLVHGNYLADAFAPLLREPALADRYRLIRYRRVGHGGSSHRAGPVDIAQQAAHGRGILRHVGAPRAHVVGHSYGGVIALQLALDAPEAVHSLALLEPALFEVPSAGPFLQALGPAFGMYAAGDAAGALDLLQRAWFGPEYRRVLAPALPPGAFEQAVADADTFFRVEVPAHQAWRFTREDAARITQPVLAVRSADGLPLFGEVSALLQDWLPQTEALVLPNATHALQLQNPRGMAEGLVGFFARHPFPATT
jgi:pimeloyl-ACP methyl ester carboxylesterase